jgi:hypothetical protein
MPLLQHQPRGEPVERRKAYRYPFVWAVSAVDPVLGSLATGASVTEPTRTDLLQLDIDLRLSSLWADALDIEEWDLESVGAFLRAAYGKGYWDALAEAERGELCKTHGYATPSPGQLRRAA